MKVLITGSNGFVGRNLAEYLSARDFSVLSADIANAEISLDVTDREQVQRKLSEADFEAVVHLAAITNIPKTINDPYGCYRVNCVGTLNLLEIARLKRVRRFIYASSANVCALPRKLPVTEEAEYNPRTPYDYSKVIGELMLRSYHTHTGLPGVILRSWKLFGEYDSENAAIPRFVRACLRNEPLPLYNEGRDTTDPYHVKNYCHAVELCLSKDEAVGEIFNVGTGGEVSVRQLAELIKKLTNSTSGLRFLPPRTNQEKTPMRNYPSIQKITEKLGYRPTIGLEEGLKETIQFYKRAVTDSG